MNSTTRKTVSLDSDVAKTAINKAKADSRSLSNYVNKLLRERFEAAESTQSKLHAGKEAVPA